MLFLEVSTHLFLPYLSNLPARNEFTELFFNAYICSRKDSLSLREIQEPVWSYTIDHCISNVPFKDIVPFQISLGTSS